MLDEMAQRNASKFAIIFGIQKPIKFFFSYSFCGTLFSSLMNVLAFISEKNKVAQNEKKTR